jgi:hypothetical protein
LDQSRTEGFFVHVRARGRTLFDAWQRFDGGPLGGARNAGDSFRPKVERGPDTGNAAKTPMPISQSLAARSNRSLPATANPAPRKAPRQRPAVTMRRSGNRYRAIRPDGGLGPARSAKPCRVQSSPAWVKPEPGCGDGRARTTVPIGLPTRPAPGESPTAASIGTSASLCVYSLCLSGGVYPVFTRLPAGAKTVCRPLLVIV